MSLGKVIRKYRKIRNLTQEEMASRLGVSAPATDLIVKIRQNNRTDNEVTLISPSSLRGPQAIYEHMPQLIFPGGKNTGVSRP